MFLLADYISAKDLPNRVVVATDIGSAKRARNFAEMVDAPLAIVEKRRMGNADMSEVLNIIGDVEGKSAILLDDEIDTAGSITQAAEVVMQRGAVEVYACCTHPILSGPAIERLKASPIKELVATDTVPRHPENDLTNYTVLSVAPLLAETIWRIHTGRSVGAVFDANRQGLMDNN